MKIILISVLLASSVILHSCSNCSETQTKIDSPQKQPAAITRNLSVVEAEVIDIITNGDEFKVKAKILSVESNESVPSIAVAGEEYILTPNLRTDNGALLENEINSNLLSLRNYSAGQKFKAEISLEQKSGWFIQRVIK